MNLYSYLALSVPQLVIQIATKLLHIKLFNIYEFHENRRKENGAFVKGLNEMTFAHVPVKSYDTVKVKNDSVNRLSPSYVLFRFFNRLVSVLTKPLDLYPHLGLPSPPIAVHGFQTHINASASVQYFSLSSMYPVINPCIY